MIDIEKIENIDDKKHVALLDASSISFMQGLKMKGIQPEEILKDYLIWKHMKSGFKGYMMNGQFLKICCLLVE